MNPSLWRILAFLLLVVPAFGAAPPVDPLVGDWLYHLDQPVTFYADGTVRHQKGGGHGTWEFMKNPEVQRHYRIVWEQGKYIDMLILAEDGRRAHVVNQSGTNDRYDVRRAISDKPAASPTPAPGMAGPAVPTPKQINPPDAADPIVGDWNWLKGQSVTFQTDGTAVANNGGRGTWEFLHNPEPERKYRVTWSPGKYVCEVVYNPATQTGRATNTKGKMFDVTRKMATPGKPTESYFGAPGR